jgi:D-lactate dehydrogenase (cytochrome)
MLAFNTLSSVLIDQLTAIVGAENLSTAQAELELRSRDQSAHPAHLPDVVVWPTTAQQVADVLRAANEAHTPVTAWGVGTSLEGNPVPVHGGILLSLERMNRILEVHADDFQVTVQPGIPYKDMNAQLARYGLFFAPDPGANASIGGMLANNASGIRTVRYGASRDNVLRMQVALADGRLITVGSRSVKQSSGYDLLHLFIGSEGTLGIITEATLKLYPIPQYMSAVVASFPSVEAAVETVVAVRASGLDPAALEFIDSTHAQMLSQADGIDLGSDPVLFMEFHAAYEETLRYGLETVRQICEENGALSVRATTDNTERKKLWHARHHSYETMIRMHPQEKFYIMDVGVPISRYPELIAFARATLAQFDVKGYLIGHAGDGNVHVELAHADDESYARAMQVSAAIVGEAIRMGGTSTGEHGVGVGKVPYMAQEHGAALDVMRAIKQTLDPNGILNPGKIFP